MAKNSSTTKYFKIPEALVFGWSFMMTVEFIVDRVPQFQSVAGARKGAKLIDAVEAALKVEGSVVTWPSELWDEVVKFINSDAFHLPKNFLMRNGVPTDQIVPLKDYLPHIDAILEAGDEAPKSEVEEPVAKAQHSSEEKPALAS